MTTEERLARVEALVETQSDDIKDLRVEVRELKDDIREMLQALHMGKGAGWLLVKIGTGLIGIAAVAKVVIDAVKHP
jgi:hypothetical protein